MKLKRLLAVAAVVLLPMKAEAATPVAFIPNPAPAVQDGALASVIREAMPQDGGTWAVAVHDLNTGRSAVLNGDVVFPTASLYKTGVMYELYRQKKAGLVSVDDVLTEQPYDYDDEGTNLVGYPGAQVSAGWALELMMRVSDNVAASMLEDRVGRANVNAAFESLGLHDTRVHTFAAGDPLPPNAFARTTASDMLRLYETLATGTAVDAASNREMLNLLLGNEVNDRIPANLPDGTPVAHKNGELDGVVSDAGIVYGPKTAYVIVVLSKGIPNVLSVPQLHGPAAEAALAASVRISRAVYDYLEAG